MLIWLLPIGLPLLLSIPLIVWTSRSSLGQQLRARSLLLTPEESVTPAVLQRAWAHAQIAAPAADWRQALTDPWLFDVVRSAMGPRNTGWGRRGKARRLLMRGLFVNEDTARLSAADRMRLLSEPQNFVRLRDQIAAHARMVPRPWVHGAVTTDSRTSTAHAKPASGLAAGPDREAAGWSVPATHLPAMVESVRTMASA